MARDEYYDEPYEDEYYDEDGLQEIYEKPAWLRNMPAFAVSAVLHLILIVIVGFVIMHKSTKKKTETVSVVQSKRKPPPKYDPKKKRDTKRTPKIPSKVVKQPVVVKKIEKVTTDIPKGTSFDNMSNVNRQSNMIHTAIGSGGGAAGAYGHRNGRGSLVSEGGGPGTESAVLAALEWLYRHQSKDGGWKAENFTEDVREARGESTNKDPKRYPSDKGHHLNDVGVTALAILAFTGFGHTHHDGEYPHFVKALRGAVKYMTTIQDQSRDPSSHGSYPAFEAKHDDGSVGEYEEWVYNHSIATMAMAELLLMSSDELRLKRSVRSAVELCLRAQNEGKGWRYGIKPGNNDTSVTGWMVLALKTAKSCNLGIPKDEYKRAFGGALDWFEYATDSKGKTGYMTPGDPGSALQIDDPTGAYKFSKDQSCMTAVAVLCRLFAGEKRSTSSIRQGVDILMQEPPVWREAKGRQESMVNLYYWYYGTYALFQFGGKPWKEWNEDMKKALINNQRAEYKGDSPEVDGSWDPIGEWGRSGGRVYATALGAMTLEVYYRFERQKEGIGL